MEPTRIEDLDEEERQPFHGITNVVPIEATAQLRETVARFAAGCQTAVRAYAEAMRPFVEELARAVQALRDAGPIPEDGEPARRSDRPAWQSPYGPPARRRSR
ncbi:hypothetical protein AB0F46_35270 [Streptomyces sp. NPDC026665]|uniref:hypothetical protein n=1 Tax=Streptomyces sp. NPDC026665 TaxID=3154798 RepID=UPI0033D144E8